MQVCEEGCIIICILQMRKLRAAGESCCQAAWLQICACNVHTGLKDLARPRQGSIPGKGKT